MLELSTKLSTIQNIQPRFQKKLERLGLKTVRDLLYHFPTRYEDFSETYVIENLEPNQQATVRAAVESIDVKRTWRRKMILTEAYLTDETGTIRAVWFNQPYVKNILRPGRTANFAGKIYSDANGLYLSNPAYEVSAKEVVSRHTGRLVPIYPETKGFTSKGIRLFTDLVLQDPPALNEFIPDFIREAYHLPELTEALHSIHFPKEIEDALEARKRFAFEELYLLQLWNIKERRALQKEKAPALHSTPSEIDDLIDKLPFPLTGAQKKVLAEISQDISKDTPMNRLLQGDVGSGKTVVAALSALVASKNGYQTAFMAPTEVLARQHYETLKKLFLPYPQKVNIGFIAAGGAKIFWNDDLESETKKPEFVKEVSAGKIDILVGTHALIEKNIKFKALGLVIIDEQHRFGVRQRAALLRNANNEVGSLRLEARESKLQPPTSKHHSHPIPHFLSMSATPIPRTLTLTLFGDLELSIIDEMPVGRKPVITKAVAPANRAKAYAFIRGEIKKGRQAFVICPRIEEAKEDDKKEAISWNAGWDDVKTVTQEFETLSKKVFPDLKIAMLHGKMPSRGGSSRGGPASGGKPNKEQVMRDFKDGKIDILVSTSVIEVGVDIPNASVMVIEAADRFGLAQLYQFRGRVGRGEHQSYCLLFTDSSSKGTSDRLNALLTAKNGFELAEKDLAIRGPGEFLGASQSGMPDIAMRALQNINLIKDARQAAEETYQKDENLESFPLLKQKVNDFEKQIHME